MGEPKGRTAKAGLHRTFRYSVIMYRNRPYKLRFALSSGEESLDFRFYAVFPGTFLFGWGNHRAALPAACGRLRPLNAKQGADCRRRLIRSKYLRMNLGNRTFPL